MSKMLTTKTLWRYGSPSLTYLRGHAGVREFNRAQKREWPDASSSARDIEHGYLRCTSKPGSKNKGYVICTAKAKGAFKATYSQW